MNSFNLWFQEVLLDCLFVFNWLYQICLFRCVQWKSLFLNRWLHCFFLSICFISLRNWFTSPLFFLWINLNLFYFLFQGAWLCTLSSLWMLIDRSLGLQSLHNIFAILCFGYCLKLTYLALIFVFFSNTLLRHRILNLGTLNSRVKKRLHFCRLKCRSLQFLCLYSLAR